MRRALRRLLVVTVVTVVALVTVAALVVRSAAAQSDDEVKARLYTKWKSGDYVGVLPDLMLYRLRSPGDAKVDYWIATSLCNLGGAPSASAGRRVLQWINEGPPTGPRYQVPDEVRTAARSAIASCTGSGWNTFMLPSGRPGFSGYNSTFMSAQWPDKMQAYLMLNDCKGLDKELEAGCAKARSDWMTALKKELIAEPKTAAKRPER